MKRYEKMGIDPNTVDGMKRLIDIDCVEISDEYGNEYGNNGHCKYPDAISCERCKAERLLKEVSIKKVLRGTTYTDFMKAYDDYAKENEWHTIYGLKFARWLNEEIEVEE